MSAVLLKVRKIDQEKRDKVFKILVGTKVGKNYHRELVWCGLKINSYITSQCKEVDWDNDPELQSVFTSKGEAENAIERIGLRNLYDSVEIIPFQTLKTKSVKDSFSENRNDDNKINVEMTLEEKEWFLNNYPSQNKLF